MLTLISYIMTQRITRLFTSNTTATGSPINFSRASPRTELLTCNHFASWNSEKANESQLNVCICEHQHTRTHMRAQDRPGDASSTAKHLRCWDHMHCIWSRPQATHCTWRKPLHWCHMQLLEGGAEIHLTVKSQEAHTTWFAPNIFNLVFPTKALKALLVALVFNGQFGINITTQAV